MITKAIIQQLGHYIRSLYVVTVDDIIYLVETSEREEDYKIGMYYHTSNYEQGWKYLVIHSGKKRDGSFNARLDDVLHNPGGYVLERVL